MSKVEDDKATYLAVGVLVTPLLVAVSMVLNVAMHGVIGSLLWGWFVTPVFDVPSPGVVACVGLSMVISYFFKPWNVPDRAKTKEEEELAYGMGLRTFLCLLFNLVFLLVAWLFHICFSVVTVG